MSFEPSKHMMDLKGKDYLEVKWRIVWMREEHPDWTITSDMLEVDADHAIFKATISNAQGNIIASAHGSETKGDFKDYVEKAESKAVGRALAYCGYGTQFSPDLEEGPRIVDSPVDRSTKPAPTYEHKAKPIMTAMGFSEVTLPADAPTDKLLNTVPMAGGKMGGKAWKDIDSGYLEWMVEKSSFGEDKKGPARQILAWRKSMKPAAHDVPMPTDDDAPDEELKEEPPF